MQSCIILQLGSTTCDPHFEYLRHKARQPIDRTATLLPRHASTTATQDFYIQDTIDTRQDTQYSTKDKKLRARDVRVGLTHLKTQNIFRSKLLVVCPLWRLHQSMSSPLRSPPSPQTFFLI